MKLKTKTKIGLYRPIIGLLLLLFVACIPSFAQAATKKDLKGTVVSPDGAPLLGATVVVEGTTIGVSTNLEGEFEISIPDEVESPVIHVSYIGYEDMSIAVGERTYIDVAMKNGTVEMESLVVTALGIKRSEKAISYNVQTVDSDELVKVKDANFVNSLSGKVAGVIINSSSAGTGSAAKVVMRGQKSIMQSSNALYVIDGIPMISTYGTGDSLFGSRGTTEPIADINPEDIESISVLNGASAAALYGSDAANGVILVTTRKGKEGKTEVSVTSGLELSSPFVMPDFQNTYGTGDIYSSIENISMSWGEKLTSANAQSYDPAKDYFRTGSVWTNNVSVSTGNEKNQTYLSAGTVNSDGIIENSSYNRYNFSARNTSKLLDDRMTLDFSANYIMQNDRNMTNQGTYGNPIVGAYLFPRGNSWDEIEIFERWDPIRKLYTQYWPSGDCAMAVQNPYWINYRNLKEGERKRYMLSASVDYKITDWMSASARIKIDNDNYFYSQKNYATTTTLLTNGSTRGNMLFDTSINQQTYGDVMLNIDKSWLDGDLSLHANIGASISDVQSDKSSISGPISDGSEMFDGEPVGLANCFIAQNISSKYRNVYQDGWREQNQALFASAEIGYRDTYYLTLTGRNDWPSQLAGPRSNTKSYFYPSVGFSVLVSELFDNMPTNLSYVKLRGSFASVGVAFERYLANPHYEYNYATSTWSNTTQYPITNLLPERTNSYEVGLNVRFLRHFNFDLSLYSATTKNQTFNPQLPVSGWSSIYLQTGEIVNKGMELALGYSNEWNKFAWSSNFTMSLNRNKIKSLADNVMNPVTGETISIDQLSMGGIAGALFILREGGTLGDLYSSSDLIREADNSIYVDESGSVFADSIDDIDNYLYLGSAASDANMAWRNDFRYGNFNFGFMVTARLGGIVMSSTQSALNAYGVSQLSADNRDAGGVFINNNKDCVNPKVWYDVVAELPQYNTYSATNVRLQELSIGYNIPRKWLGDVCDINVSLVGRNLFMIYNKAPYDPEATATTGNFYQGIDNFMLPSLRNVGFNVRLKF